MLYWAWVSLVLGRPSLGIPKPPNLQRIQIPVASPHLSPGQLAPAIHWQTLGGRVSLGESLPAVIDVYKPGPLIVINIGASIIFRLITLRLNVSLQNGDFLIVCGSLHLP